MNPQQVGLLIRQKRQELKMTQKELAERLNVTDKAVSQWERGVCFPNICTIEALTTELHLSLTEIFTNSAEPLEQQEEMDMAILNTLTFAQASFKSKIKRYKWIGGALFAFPLCAFLAWLGVTALLVYAAPQAAFTETAGFLLLALGLYLLRLGLPFLFGYSILIWKDSHFMRTDKKARVKSALCFVGILIVCIWLYESLKTILPNLIS